MNAPDAEVQNQTDRVPIRRALLSVSDKTDLLPLAAALAVAGVEIVSTGSTAQRIREAGHRVTDVADLTGFPESLDGRVKTLHPAVHAGLLADLRRPDHARQLADLGIAPFELVVSNLYPFAETVASGASGDAVVEQIDIGGPAMVRAAAKNFANVAIVTGPAQYPLVTEQLAAGGTTLAIRRALAAAAFAHTAAYDGAVAAWFATESTTSTDTDTGTDADTGPRARVSVTGDLGHVLRYGENAHQTAALYRDGAGADRQFQSGSGLAQSEQLGGKEMSYNNYVDADAALRSAYDFAEPTVAVIKHANPCGIATADSIDTAHQRAHACDPVSAYGGVIAANRTVTLPMAERVKGIFTEVIVAPDFDEAALELLKSKKNLRILCLPVDYERAPREYRQISGGFLVQDGDRFAADTASITAGWTLVAGEAADAATLADLAFAWKACRSVKSNAILLASGGASVGVGMGQVNRVDACELAVRRAGERVAGSVAASDAFFPFADGLEVLLRAGVRAIVQPGGSIRDEEVVAAATDAGATMYTTGERHFYH